MNVTGNARLIAMLAASYRPQLLMKISGMVAAVWM